MNTFFNWLYNKLKYKSGKPLSSKKEKQFQEMQYIWNESTKIPMSKVPNSQQEWLKLERTIRITENKSKTKVFNPFLLFIRKPQIAAAFSFALLAVVTGSLHFSMKPTIYTTQNMERRSVTLADGSTVQLNAGSKLSVPKRFNKNSRTLKLNGEAYFEVQKSQAPFIVQTDVGDVTVLGTKFNVNSRNEIMEVAVNQGLVQVTTTSSIQDSSVLLTKDKMIVCSAGEYPGVPHRIQFKEYPGWLINKMTLDETELIFVLEEIERRFDVDIQQEDKTLDALEISGLFYASDLDSLMSSLCILIQKEYRHEDHGIVIY